MSEETIAAKAMPSQDPPGYKAAKVCGILGICFAVTCVGFPLALVFGIIALVKQGKAKRLAREYPETYRMPASGAMIMGIVALGLVGLSIPMMGMGAAIAIPAFMMQREKARTAELEQNVQAVRLRAEQLAMDAQLAAQGPEAEPIVEALLSDASLASLKNPFAPDSPAMERAETPSQHGTVALWPTLIADEESGGSTVTIAIVATYPKNQATEQFIEYVTVASVPPEETPMPEPILEEPPAQP